MPLDLVLSPYDLTARSAAAVGACLLGDRVLTLMPAPESANASTNTTALAHRNSPAFARLSEAWAWSGPLWRAGVITTGMDGPAVTAALNAARKGIDRDPSMLALTSLMSRTDPGGSGEGGESKRFDAICRDLVTGGINPAVTVPLGAAVDNFAAAHALTLVRGTPRSMVGRLEKAGERIVFRLSVLTAVEADASDLVQLRAALSESAAPFRAAVTRLLDHTRGRARAADLADALGSADAHRAAFESALEDRAERLRAASSFSGQRLKIARVTLTGACQDSGTTVMAARRAAVVLEARTGERTNAEAPPEPASESTALARGPLVVLTLKPATLQVRPGPSLAS
ncbi:MAG: hypothetical protein ACKVZJ_04650 [Phycisphaerales bacterium]